MASTRTIWLLRIKLLHHSLNHTRLDPTSQPHFRLFRRTYLSEQRQTDDERDVFGTLSTSGRKELAVKAIEHLTPDDPDGYDKEEIDLTPRKNAFYYDKEINNYARKGKFGIQKALDLFHEMKSVARLPPGERHLIPLIYGCGKAGYTKKAFELFDEWLRNETKPTKSMITSLAQACSECPFPEYGLKRLDWLVDSIRTTYNMKMNQIHYHSMIKAYGKLGRMDKASEMLQDMIDNDIAPNTETINMLLIGCNSEKELGVSLALRLFKRMKYYSLKPDIYTYNLLARCIQNCKLGPAHVLEQTVLELPVLANLDDRIKYKRISNKLTGKKENIRDKLDWQPLVSDLGVSVKRMLEDSKPEIEANQLGETTQSTGSTTLVKRANDVDTLIFCPQNLPLLSSSHDIPNFLTDDPLILSTRIRSINLSRLESPSGRLLLLGGIHGFLEAMRKDSCDPSIATFHSLLQCLARSEANLIEFLRLAKEHKIKKNLFFYDSVIEYVCSHFGRLGRIRRALQLIDDMQAEGIRPSISTYEALAFACDTWTDAKQLVDDLKRAGVVISQKMIGRFFSQAIRLKDYEYLNHLISLSMEHNFRPSKYLVDKLEEARLSFRDMVRLQEENSTGQELDDRRINQGKRFCGRMKEWLNSTKVMTEDHPWAQFEAKTGSRRDKFQKFEEKYRILNKVKWQSVQQGGPLGNLLEKADQMMREKENRARERSRHQP